MTEAVLFSTTLRPYRSLSPEGFKWLIRAALAANLVIGLPMYLLGAWPVMGFMGLDIYLLWYMFQRSYFDARRSETLTMTDRELIIERRSPEGEREEHRLDAYWLRVEPGERRLAVASRGQRVVVGRFLSPAAREELADQLKQAHARLRGWAN
ncbi:MAG TPA: DUF2244 domain-containing protein [Reyranella sp.]|jgi:uncharacterized membrane protein|nr:DUF2244 domain-containing protein [Reyranella sp.]